MINCINDENTPVTRRKWILQISNDRGTSHFFPHLLLTTWTLSEEEVGVGYTPKMPGRIGSTRNQRRFFIQELEGVWG